MNKIKYLVFVFFLLSGYVGVSQNFEVEFSVIQRDGDRKIVDEWITTLEGAKSSLKKIEMIKSDVYLLITLTPLADAATNIRIFEYKTDDENDKNLRDMSFTVKDGDVTRFQIDAREEGFVCEITAKTRRL